MNVHLPLNVGFLLYKQRHTHNLPSAYLRTDLHLNGWLGYRNNSVRLDCEFLERSVRVSHPVTLSIPVNLQTGNISFPLVLLQNLRLKRSSVPTVVCCRHAGSFTRKASLQLPTLVREEGGFKLLLHYNFEVLQKKWIRLGPTQALLALLARHYSIFGMVSLTSTRKALMTLTTPFYK